VIRWDHPIRVFALVKCTEGQVRRLKTALHWKGNPELRQRIQMVLLRESGMTQPAGAMGVSLSTVNRAHMAYDHGRLKAHKSKPTGGRRNGEMIRSPFVACSISAAASIEKSAARNCNSGATMHTKLAEQCCHVNLDRRRMTGKPARR
jgi:hypothetical protein